LSPLSSKKIQADPIVEEEMDHLWTNVQYKITIIHLTMYCVKFIVLQSLNTHALNLHFKDILVDPNLLAHHIFFVLMKQKYEIFMWIMKCTMPYNKVHFLSYHNGHGIMIFYDKTMLLWEISNRQQFCAEFILAYFNKNICETFFIFAIYKLLQCKHYHFFQYWMKFY